MMDKLDIERAAIWRAMQETKHEYVRVIGAKGPPADLMSHLLDRYIAARRRHWEPEIGEAHFPDDWRNRLRDRFPALDGGFDHGPGWSDIYYAVCEWAEEAGEAFGMSYAKEKWGILSIFPTAWPGGDLSFIEEAMEQLSGFLCEECGAPGQRQRRGGWIVTRCEKHAEGQR
jgi:hypothetical protein